MHKDSAAEILEEDVNTFIWCSIYESFEKSTIILKIALRDQPNHIFIGTDIYTDVEDNSTRDN